MNEPLPPSRTAEVSFRFGSHDYLGLCELLYGDGSTDWWAALADLLSGRPGWHCELNSDGLAWCFGAGGTCVFNVFAPEDPEVFETTTYHLFDYKADESLLFASPDDLRDWLEDNEHRHAEHLRSLPWHYAETGDWGILTLYAWPVKVTHDGTLWIGTVPEVPGEATFADTLPDLMDQIRELIGQAVGAPADIAPGIQLAATLDQSATAALTNRT